MGEFYDDIGEPIENSYAHHIKPYADGGKTEEENCQLLCKDCHSIKHGYKESN
jgi:5-methylcytosine-specific restriction endonuclease McrA